MSPDLSPHAATEGLDHAVICYNDLLPQDIGESIPQCWNKLIPESRVRVTVSGNQDTFMDQHRICSADRSDHAVVRL